jgi:hypothetical protein
MTEETPLLPPAAAIVRFSVADFDAWLVGFNDHEESRREAGILGHHINRGEEDPNDISVFMALSDLDKARTFAASDDLRVRMHEAGVSSAPQTTWMTPVRQEIIWDRELPSLMLSHSVADFDRWLEGYDAAADLQKANGIVGQAVNRSLEDPAVAIIYHQAESFGALRAFLANDELKAAMHDAGVVSAPEVRFVTGGWAKMYL